MPQQSRSSSAKPKKLLVQARDKLRLKSYAYETEKTYVGWIKRYIFFHQKRHPVEIGKAEVEAFLTSLAVEQKVQTVLKHLTGVNHLVALLLYGSGLRVNECLSLRVKDIAYAAAIQLFSSHAYVRLSGT